MAGITFLKAFLADRRAAISPLYAVAILPLIVMAGVAFDYSRLMSMDSELQNAADQAALAAATQLNGQTGAMAEAEDAARNYFVNETRAAAGERPITDFSLAFYEANFDDDGNFDPSGGALDPDEASNDALAKVVEVTIAGRRARYALTPVMGALFSDAVAAKATAMLDESHCNVAPMMFCAPSPGYGSTSSDVGDTIRMHLRDPSTETSELDVEAPGNFGFLDLDYDITKKPNDRMGLNTQSGVCIGGRVVSDTGNRQVEMQYFNTRFERYDSAANSAKCDAAGNFCSSQNIRQTRVQVQTDNNNPTPTKACDPTPAATGWQDMSTAGYPNQSCIDAGTCSFQDSLTDADWTSYMNTAHSGTSIATAGGPTRYGVYTWERDNPSLGPVKVSSTSTPRVNGRGQPIGGYVVTNYCAYPTPRDSKNVFAPSEADKDRRVLTIAAADCSDLHGKGTVKVLRWLDVFLVDGARTRGSAHEFVAEIIGPGTPAGGGNGFQYFGRGKAVLIQ